MSLNSQRGGGFTIKPKVSNGQLQQKYEEDAKNLIKKKGANAVLAGLLRLFLLDLGLHNAGRYAAYMQDYLLDPRNGVPNNRKDQTSKRGNMSKEFNKLQITWKVLCKGLRFMKFIKVKITITGYHVNGKVYVRDSGEIPLNRFIKSGDDPDDVVEFNEDLPYVASLDNEEEEE